MLHLGDDRTPFIFFSRTTSALITPDHLGADYTRPPLGAVTPDHLGRYSEYGCKLGIHEFLVTVSRESESRRSGMGLQTLQK